MTRNISPQTLDCIRKSLTEMNYSLEEIENGGVSDQDLRTAMGACGVGRLPTSVIPIRTVRDGLGQKMKKFFGFE